MLDEQNPPESQDPVISIGVLAARVGLSVSAVRKYENEGLIIAHRTDAGHRLFSHEDIARVRHIQHLIQDVGLNIEAIRRMQALLPCWDMRPCDVETRGRCPVYEESTRPCWTMKGLACAQQGNECRRCDVYRLGSLCTEEVKQVLHDLDGCEDVRSLIRTLVERKRHMEATER